MVEAIELWNEPNNSLYWDRSLDPRWHILAAMLRRTAASLRRNHPRIRLVLGGISPIDPGFVATMQRRGVLDEIDAVGVHGFPLDWHGWRLDEWPRRIAEVEAVTDLPVWVTATGASSFGGEEIQAFGLARTAQLLVGRVARVYWSMLFDWTSDVCGGIAPDVGRVSSRGTCQGLVRGDGTYKQALESFNPELGVCQWFTWEDERLERAVQVLKWLGVRKLRTGISWGDWCRPNAREWFDRLMSALAAFEITLTLCSTPLSRGRAPSSASPPTHPDDFVAFAVAVADRYMAAPLPARGREVAPVCC